MTEINDEHTTCQRTRQNWNPWYSHFRKSFDHIHLLLNVCLPMMQQFHWKAMQSAEIHTYVHQKITFINEMSTRSRMDELQDIHVPMEYYLAMRVNKPQIQET